MRMAICLCTFSSVKYIAGRNLKAAAAVKCREQGKTTALHAWRSKTAMQAKIRTDRLLGQHINCSVFAHSQIENSFA